MTDSSSRLSPVPELSRRPRFPLGVGAKIAASRLALIWERLWPGLWPAASIAAFFLALALLDVLILLPSWAHTLVLAAALGAFAVALAYAAFRFRWPLRADAIRRLERTNELMHRPLGTYADRLALDAKDSDALSLWEKHRARASVVFARIALELPHPHAGRRDRYGLRWFAGLSLVLALIVAWSDAPGRLRAAFLLDGAGAALAVTLDAWITPPSYTGKPPYVIAGESAQFPGAIGVPQGSLLTLRADGLEQSPRLVLDVGEDQAAPAEPVTRDLGHGLFEITATLSQSATLRLYGAGRELAVWSIGVVPDSPPAITLIEPPSVTQRLSLSFAYAVADDYGVAGVELRMKLDAPGGAAEPQVFALPAPPAGPGSHALSAIKDFTSHVWAGLPVEIVLAAADAAGQTGATAPVKLTLPERQFRNPLAKALVEQRKELIVDAGNARKVARVLAALTLKPEKYFDDRVLYLGIRVAMRRLDGADSPEDVAPVQELLYDLALRAEDGDLSLAADALRQIQEQLAEALRNDAPDEEIERLIAELKEALARYLEELAQSSPTARAELPSDMRIITPGDLSRMLDSLEDLSRSGARDEASQLLSELQQLLDNLQAGAAPELTPEEKAMGEALDQLGDLIARERALRDETFRREMQQTYPDMDSPQGPQTGDDLASAQKQLQDQLGSLLGKLGENGGQAAAPLGRAGEAMGEAKEGLARRDFGSAGGHEDRALSAMQDAAEALANQLMQAMRERGAMVAGRSGAMSRDPLGRESDARGPLNGNDVRVPDEREMKRTREILEELERRAAERARPKPELDYYERLLRRF